MSIRSSTFQGEKKKVARFHRLDTQHILAIEALYKQYPFLRDRMEIHMPYGRAAHTFSTECVWVWPKFDRRPAGYLIFLDGFAPCIWYPERQEGMTFRWILPPGFLDQGPCICLANLLAGESLVQIEDMLVYNGISLWSAQIYSKRWNILQDFWNSLPSEQPLMECKVQLVQPISLADWPQHYNAQIYWIIQPDHCKAPRWYWKDIVTTHHHVEYHAPTMKRNPVITHSLYARCTPEKSILPDNYCLYSQEGDLIGIASIGTLSLSMQLREKTIGGTEGLPVEVQWNERFSKYQVVRILPADTPITTSSFFHHK
jgi:hypothetical protein